MSLFTRYSHWKYNNTTLLLLSAAVFIAAANIPTIQRALTSVGDWGYFGAVIAGIFSASTFTVAPALVFLYYLAERHNPIIVALLAGFGAVIGDFLIFSFFKEKVFEELRPIVTRFSKHPIMHMFHSPYFAWLGPVVGAVIIASPLPDELGITLLTASKLTKWQFILLSFVLNSGGMFVLIVGAQALFD